MKKKAKDKLDLRKYQLFGPNYYEKVQPGQDEIDYNVEASEKETDKDIQLGKTFIPYITLSFYFIDHFLPINIVAFCTKKTSEFHVCMMIELGFIQLWIIYFCSH